MTLVFLAAICSLLALEISNKSTKCAYQSVSTTHNQLLQQYEQDLIQSSSRVAALHHQLQMVTESNGKILAEQQTLEQKLKNGERDACVQSEKSSQKHMQHTNDMHLLMSKHRDQILGMKQQWDSERDASHSEVQKLKTRLVDVQVAGMWILIFQCRLGVLLRNQTMEQSHVNTFSE